MLQHNAGIIQVDRPRLTLIQSDYPCCRTCQKALEDFDFFSGDTQCSTCTIGFTLKDLFEIQPREALPLEESGDEDYKPNYYHINHGDAYAP